MILTLIPYQKMNFVRNCYFQWNKDCFEKGIFSFISLNRWFIFKLTFILKSRSFLYRLFFIFCYIIQNGHKRKTCSIKSIFVHRIKLTSNISTPHFSLYLWSYILHHTSHFTCEAIFCTIHLTVLVELYSAPHFSL